MRAYAFSLLLLVSLGASAGIPPQSQWSWSFSKWSGTAGSAQAACDAGAAAVRKGFEDAGACKSPNPCSFVGTVSGSGSQATCTVIRNGYDPYTVQIGAANARCPENSSSNGTGNCTCNTGFVEKGNQCVPKKDDKCGDLEGKPLGVGSLEINVGVASNGALARMIGGSGTSCFPGGCKVSGTVSGCVNSGAGGATCMLSGSSFTGESCDDKAPPGNCPEGSTPSQYAAGVCVPNEPGSCPSGQSPSKSDPKTCVPDSDPNADGPDSDGPPNKCPSGYVPSKYVADLCIPGDSVTDQGGNTTCRGNVCTTTKPDGTQEDKPKDQFCKENPDSPLCVKGEFGGTCSAGFQCKGDAIQCAIARNQHETNCKLFGEDKDPSSLYNQILRGQDRESADFLRNNAQQVTVGNFDSSGFGWSHTCPPDPEIALSFLSSGSLVIPFSRICGPLNVLSLAAVSLTLLGCLLWVLGPKKG